VTQLFLPTMTRLSIVTFLALAFSGVALAAPPASQGTVAVDGVRTMVGWSNTDCGMCVVVFRGQPLNGAMSRGMQCTPPTLQ